MASYIFKPNDKPLPPKVAEALVDYYKKHGSPPPVTESIEIHVVDGVVVIKPFSVKETE